MQMCEMHDELLKDAKVNIQWAQGKQKRDIDRRQIGRASCRERVLLIV